LIIYAGGVYGPLDAPFVYFVRSRELLYVGETQGHPVLRWGGHLQTFGSFRVAVANKGDPDVDYLDDICFYAFHCSLLQTHFPPAQYKVATQAVEHRVHTTLALRPHALGYAFRLISDTEKTAPRRFKEWTLAQSLAEAIVEALGRLVSSSSQIATEEPLGDAQVK
jgi:hypothetical protein